ncbi:hypothetical protein DFH07DRAFT_783006 [Mycena maculata]|uniref:Zn(2)-C6 fungal-type domain-containing protein n=1 Tax=Mycena maculata TaxID=230809 RepID=A0AAD7HPU6_9AGAR|nr:hypothetical protein DFH07DRAFT_783006 [Mycena maculata]
MSDHNPVDPTLAFQMPCVTTEESPETPCKRCLQKGLRCEYNPVHQPPSDPGRPGTAASPPRPQAPAHDPPNTWSQPPTSNPGHHRPPRPSGPHAHLHGVPGAQPFPSGQYRPHSSQSQFYHTAALPTVYSYPNGNPQMANVPLAPYSTTRGPQQQPVFPGYDATQSQYFTDSGYYSAAPMYDQNVHVGAYNHLQALYLSSRWPVRLRETTNSRTLKGVIWLYTTILDICS